MPNFRVLRLALILPVLCAGFCFACGDEDEADEGDATMEREGPEGCYIPAGMLCDCDIEEAACTTDVGVWTAGCDSCAE
jgi:hypothetical protein